MNEFTPAAGRRLHVVDVENLLGGTVFSAGEVTHLKSAYLSVVGGLETDPVVLGASADQAALSAGTGWPGKRLVVRRGADGADLALLEVLLDELAAPRFRGVIIGSGDGIFTEVASQLAATGVVVTVVSRRRSLSRRLRLAATRVVILEDPTLAPIMSGAA